MYRHFCMMARALEVLGERWTLLLVRDLLLGARRFTDLHRTVAGITPKLLTERLRELEEAGIVSRHSRKGRREVWYELTASGLALQPVVDALTLWGIEHALHGPRPGEPVSPDHVMQGTRVWLNNHGQKPDGQLVWRWHFGAMGVYTLHFDGQTWRLARADTANADLTIETTPQDWARLLTSPPASRVLTHPITATPSRRDEFARAFAARLEL